MWLCNHFSCGCSSFASSVNELSKSVIQKDLETVQRKQIEQIILPSIVDVDDQDSVDFAQHLERSLKDSREQQKNLEAQIRKDMMYEKEKRSVVSSPEEEVIKGLLICIFYERLYGIQETKMSYMLLTK